MKGARVVVGMSGGVDSSVTAALLVEQGFDVVGITMNLAGNQSRCCSLEDADDARRVADELGIRFYVANYRARFREEVQLPFADAYLAGQTPIPCVLCNKRFKFDHLLSRAEALGAEAVATGHYARIKTGAQGPELWRGRDEKKDQSYFLFNLSRAQLSRARFPLGALTKMQVREKARALGLGTADKPASQDICFVPKGDYARVVETLRPQAAKARGEIVNLRGEVLGAHRGVHNFTVGQRRGLRLTTSSEKPQYVIRIDAEAQRVVVGGAEQLACTEIPVQRASWLLPQAPAPGETVQADVQVRYRAPAVPAQLTAREGGRVQVQFQTPQRACAAGQAAVFYQGARVIGGGWIAGKAA